MKGTVWIAPYDLPTIIQERDIPYWLLDKASKDIRPRTKDLEGFVPTGWVVSATRLTV